MRIESNSSIREKAAHAFGFEHGSVLDTLRRADYGSDEEFLDAAAALEVARARPEFQAARRKLQRELAERQEAAQREQQAVEFAKIRGSMKLDGFDKKIVDEQATELARRDLAAGRIGASDLGRCIAGHAKTLTEKRLDEMASNALFNEIIRSSR